MGTTVRGWLVVMLGFKFQLGTLLLPLIFIGAILRLFTRGRWSDAGYALAGFALIFVGLTAMQEAMVGLQGIISFDYLPADSHLGRLKLLLLGIVFTLITQSSSAGVAATLAALFTGMLQFEQAAALVIGMDIGTTATAMFATIGGSVGARRTGYSHVIYNFMTGFGAFILISPYIALWEYFAPGALMANAEIGLVAFHSLFNTLGVLIILPFTRHFAHFMQNLVPEKASIYTRGLDKSLLTESGVALRAINTSIQIELRALLHHLSALLDDLTNGDRVDLGELQIALDETHQFIDHIHLSSGQGKDWEQLIALIHALDHMQRLHERCEEEEIRARTAGESEELVSKRDDLKFAVVKILHAIKSGAWHEAANLAKAVSEEIERHHTELRQSIMERIAIGQLDVTTANYRLEAVRWLKRVSTHLERILYHLSKANDSNQPE